VPRLDNCSFVRTAAAARALGYRPCLRCRPEAAPGTPAWLGSSAIVHRALRLIAERAPAARSVESLAARVGVGARQLRRLFRAHVGASPIEVAQTERALFAKRLIDETALPMTRVAEAAGFDSLRRFNDAIRTTYGRAPRELRRAVDRGANGAGIVLRLAFRPPLCDRALFQYLAARATPGVESVTARGYRRTVRAGGRPGWVEVQRPEPGSRHVTAELYLERPAGLVPAVERLRRMFDLGADPEAIARHLERDPRLGAAKALVRGLRLPGAWSGFELAVRAILGQQVSVRGATTLAGRVAATFGEPLGPDAGRPTELAVLFPEPSALAEAPLERVGVTAARAAAIRALARAVGSGALDLDGAGDPDAVVRGLLAIPGIGPWTAQYVAMRALGEPDAFPSGDLGLRRALANRAGRIPAEREVERIAQAWRPWRAYAAIALWTAEERRKESRSCSSTTTRSRLRSARSCS
jgi:AraC family transcriptional regulator of adaptative response / DNA-3-methyladenine glycosylase II